MPCRTDYIKCKRHSTYLSQELIHTCEHQNHCIHSHSPHHPSMSFTNNRYMYCVPAATSGDAFVNPHVYQGYTADAYQNPNVLGNMVDPSQSVAWPTAFTPSNIHTSPESAWNRPEEESMSLRRGPSPPFVHDPPFRDQYHDQGRMEDWDYRQLFRHESTRTHEPFQSMGGPGFALTPADTNVNPSLQFLDRGDTYSIGTSQPMQFVLLFFVGCRMIISWQTQTRRINPAGGIRPFRMGPWPR
ncbi:hypothetical protein K439DRAFT_798583 [Ramaria rubella]|nr:hypothetical protein K439DRAFT_798583 [Ramaria rubella]